MFIIFLFSINIIQQGNFIKIQDSRCNSVLKIPGNPEMPVIRKLFTGDTTKIRVNFAYTETSLDKPIYPAQPPVIKGAPPPDFVINRNLYKRDKFYPASPYKIIYLGKQRNIPIYVFEFHPYRYNPAENKIMVAKDYNYSLPDSHIEMAKGSNLLIITSENFIPRLREYIYYKKIQGYAVQVVKVESIGKDTLSIKNTIQNLRPDYLLLVGDVNIIPAFYREGGLNTDPHYTDLCYATLDTDYIPDMVYSRISVSDTSQLSVILNKIITYDTLGGNWRKRAYFMASNDGTYHSIPESTHIYSIAEARSAGMECDSLFYYYNSGTPVDSAFNNGRSIAVYSGHGGTYQWYGPPFNFSGIDNLLSTDRLSFIMSFACLTGDYSANECMMEKWLRVPKKGGIFTFGSSTYSLWDEDDLLQRRIFDAIFTQGYREFGTAINQGKLLFAQDYGGDTSDIRSYFEQYNLFGDASLPIHISDYPPIYTDIPYIIPDTTNTLRFKIWDAGGGIYGNAGIIQDTTLYSGSSYENGDITIPVTGKKIAPFSLIITSDGHRSVFINGRFVPNAPYVLFDGLRGYSCTGIDTIYVSLKNWGSKTSINTRAYFSTDTLTAHILTDSVYYGDITPQSVVEKMLFVDIYPGHPDSIPIYLSAKDTGNTWNDTFYISVPYSHIVLKDSAAQQNLPISNFVILKFPVYNSGNAIVRNVLGTLSIDNHNVEVLKARDEIGNLQPYETKNLYFTANTSSLSIIDNVYATLNVYYPPYKTTYTIKLVPAAVNIDTTYAKIYSNIIHNKLILETLSQKGKLTIEIYDVLGRKLLRKDYQTLVGRSKWFVNVADIPKGIYFFIVNFNKNPILKGKFIKI